MVVILDLDGTLLDISEKYYLVYSSVLRENGYVPMDRERYWRMKRAGLPNRAILSDTGCPLPTGAFDAGFARAVERPESLELDRLFSGAEMFLQEAYGENELFLATLRKDRDTLLDQLSRLGIKGYFNGILNDSAPADAPAWKKKALMFMVIRPDRRATVIGDSEAEIRAGKALGLTTVALSCGIRSAQVLAAQKPDYILAGIGDAARLLMGEYGV